MISIKWKLGLLSSLTLALVFLVLCLGSTDYAPSKVLGILAQQLGLGNSSATSAEVNILWNVRLPRILLSFLVGGALAVSGTIAQSVLQNPLASPFTLGVSSGASFAAALVILCGIQIPLFPQLSQVFFAFLFAMITIFLVLSLSFRMDSSLSNTAVVLTGMVVSLFFNGLQSTITSLFATEAGKLTLWAMGTFSMRGWTYVKMALPFVLVGLLLSLCLAKELDLFSFGSKEAKSLGVHTEKIKIIAFLNMAMMTGACIAITGTIGFVDLIAPHVARKWVGNRHILLIPTSFLLGACLMTATDTIARRIISPSELPVGAVTALLGAPFFFYVYQNKPKL